MNYAEIKWTDIANGEGVRISLFVSGCTHHCKNCFNPETWDFEGGKEFTQETIDKVLELSNKNEVKGLSILGGEPMAPTNVEGTAKLAKAFKEKYPEKNVWAWSGYKYEQIKDIAALKYIDVLVDGNYEDELHDPTLKWKGSSNQRVIDVQKSLKNGGITLLK